MALRLCQKCHGSVKKRAHVAILATMRNLALALALALLCTGCGGAADDPDAHLTLPTTTTQVPAERSSHVVVIMLENRDFDQVIGNADAPFINDLSRRGALATSFYAVARPSLPNYIALTGGSTFGIKENCDSCRIAETSIVDQLEREGISWKAYMESVPRPCFKGIETELYAKKHNPFAYYDRIMDDPARCAKIQPLGALISDLTGGTLPIYSWISPNLCNDGHDCGLGKADRFLSRLMPLVERALGPHGYLVLTWDEASDENNASCCGDSIGGHIATILAGPNVKPGFRYDVDSDHYSLLKTIEESLRLPRLRRAAAPGVRSLDPMFTRPPRLR
jgi:phosphatidylinositol-3-phosphatase